jgi:hypothetical protein
MDNSIFVLIRHLDAPWIAADFAILNEAAANVWLNIDFHPLAAKRTRHNELVCHLRQSYCKASSASGAATNGSRPAAFYHRQRVDISPYTGFAFSTPICIKRPVKS